MNRILLGYTTSVSARNLVLPQGRQTTSIYSAAIALRSLSVSFIYPRRLRLRHPLLRGSDLHGKKAHARGVHGYSRRWASMTVCTQCLGAYSEHPGGLAAVKGYEQFLTCMSTMQDRVDPIVPPLLVAGLLQHVQTPTSFGIRHRSLLSRKSLLSADERPMIRPSPCGWNRSGEALDLPRDTRSISVEYWSA